MNCFLPNASQYPVTKQYIHNDKDKKSSTPEHEAKLPLRQQLLVVIRNDINMT